MPSYREVRREAQRQGWTVEPTRSGERFLSPDGSTQVLVHPADHAVKAIISRLRRGGFQWPVGKR